MSGLAYSMGFIFRETGRALDRLGCQLQGNTAFMEECESFSSIKTIEVALSLASGVHNR